ncbi:LacI family DNA-binding transcriptional regulator [Virgibacillus halodenitrificans]|uniref:LacI family DNA-binding transcriptional regulator n=1 Tax=Virgibacillus halodenitrificans TaxID=1482 RepID=UPI002DBFC8D0|nr:substrate-binding domain-containing protein [Virgibacillus halodenitrificans]MEC2159597.1 substrate-binding domain-containing protein [Virgibacillus halodenitrificans]
MKPVTIADVAKYAEVSKSTVSQYLNQRYDYMGEKTKKRIEEAIKELGYSPNIVARSLKQKSTMTIGVIVANILHVFSTQVIRAIEDYCNKSDFHIIVCNADDDPAKEKRYIDMLRAKQVDGIIAFPTGDNVELYNRLIKDDYPIVFIDRNVSDVPISTVMLDNEKASRLAIDEFVKKGYRNIAMFTPPLKRDINPRVERIKGYKEGLKKHNLSFHSKYLVSGEISELQGKMDEILQGSNHLDAILAMNDRVLFEILKYAKANQLRIPEDFALIGIDDVSFASFYSPALTTIAQPAFEMGKKAAELLLEKIKNKDMTCNYEIHRFEPELVVRSSC